MFLDSCWFVIYKRNSLWENSLWLMCEFKGIKREEAMRPWERMNSEL